MVLEELETWEEAFLHDHHREFQHKLRRVGSYVMYDFDVSFRRWLYDSNAEVDYDF